MTEADVSEWDADTAVAALHAAHYRRLVRLCVLLVRDLAIAEEVVQDAYVALYLKWSRLRDPQAALAYLRTTVVNGSRSSLRRLSTAERAEPMLRTASDTSPDPSSKASTRLDVLAALARLPERQREVIVLRYYADLSESEIAQTLGISRGSVKSYAARAATTLRPILETVR